MYIYIYTYSYPLLNLNYSELNTVKSPIGKGKPWKLLIYFFFGLCKTVLKRCKIKCYCSFNNLCLDFLFIDKFWCHSLRVFSSAINFLKFKTCLSIAS